jgi:sugar phosphate isomerase/epimerase
MYSSIKHHENYITSLDFGSYGGSLPPTAMPSQQMDKAANWGWTFVEVGLGPTGSRDAFSAGKSPPEQNRELARLAKLNKMDLSIHHTVQEDVSGFQGQGGFDEMARRRAEFNIKKTIDFADDIGSNAKKNNIPIVIHPSAGVPGNPDKDEAIYVADRDTGSVGRIKRERRFDEKTGEVRWKDPKEILDETNERLRMNMAMEATNVNYNIEYTEGQMQRAQERYISAKEDGKTEEAKRYFQEIESYAESIKLLEKRKKEAELEMKRKKIDFMNKKEKRYEQLVPIEDHAIDKVADTVANAAAYAYKKKSKPMLVVENMYPEMAFNQPEKMREVIEQSRKKFVEKMKGKMGKGTAEKAAKELIGMTLDVGHMNMWKRYQDDPKEFKKMQKKFTDLAPFIKHVHLSDNLGDMDAHLPVGWGNAPNKEVMDDLKKGGYKGNVLFETYGLPEGGHFGVYESVKGTGQRAYPFGPTWTQASENYFFGDYPMHMGDIFPPGHVQQYGMGFSGLPSALGGSAPGERSKFGGRPMS